MAYNNFFGYLLIFATLNQDPKNAIELRLSFLNHYKDIDSNKLFENIQNDIPYYNHN